MEQDKLYNQIKKAAENAEHQSFPGMEKVWNRVEDKLDHKILKKENNLLKKVAVGASVLSVTTLGFLLWNKNNNEPVKQQNIVITDTIQHRQEPLKEDSVAVAIIDQSKAVIADEPVAKEKITDSKPTLPREAVSGIEANQAPIVTQKPMIKNELVPIKNHAEPVQATVKAKQSTGATPRRNESFDNLSVENTSGKSTQQKENPLFVVNGKPIKAKDYEKYNTLSNTDDEEVESVEYLDNPLYIINGSYYTEQQLFGPNPTSPYTPLDKQEIETISVLKGEKAIAIYGKKGENGVVIITTKNGKPANHSEKKK
ncbi:hypothetical protein [Flavobacterium pedocola]